LGRTLNKRQQKKKDNSDGTGRFINGGAKPDSGPGRVCCKAEGRKAKLADKNSNDLSASGKETRSRGACARRGIEPSIGARIGPSSRRFQLASWSSGNDQANKAISKKFVSRVKDCLVPYCGSRLRHRSGAYDPMLPIANRCNWGKPAINGACTVVW